MTPGLGALERICMENFDDDSIFETSFNQYAAHNFSWKSFYNAERSNNIIPLIKYAYTRSILRSFFKAMSTITRFVPDEKEKKKKN